MSDADEFSTTIASESDKASSLQKHLERIEQLGDDTVSLCHYLGVLGIQPSQYLETNTPTTEEWAAFHRGEGERAAGIRAIELERAWDGGPIQEWMR